MDSEEPHETDQQQHEQQEELNTQEKNGKAKMKGPPIIETTKSGRKVNLTERMVAYKEDETNKRERKLNSAYDNWKAKIRDMRKALKEECCETDLAEMADTIKFTETSVIRQFETLRQAGVIKPEILRKIDALVAINADMMKIVNERLSGIDTFDPMADAKLLREIKTQEYASSIFSSVSNSTSESERSFNSTRSKISDKVIDASAELAAREAELKLLKIQQEQKEKIIEIEMKQKMELEDHQRELEELEVRKQVEVAKARLDVYKKADDCFENANVGTDNNDHLTLPKGLENKITTMLKNDKSPRTTECNYSAIPKGRPTVNYQDTETDSLAKAFAETLHLNRLPVPEPSIFTGDPIKYLEWKMSFEMLIDRKGIPSSEKIFYLKRYLGGEAQKALEGFFYSNSLSAYENPRKVLDDRYGHPFIMQRAFRERLDKWPKIGAKDPQGLRNFADFLQGCNDAMNFVPSLSVLNDCVENQKLLGKLPDWATVRWNRIVNNALETTCEYPVFSKFVEFVVKEAKIACNPVSSLYAIHDKELMVHKEKPVPSKVRTLTTVSDNKNVKNSSFNTTHNTENKTIKCVFCKHEGHYIVKCTGFLDLTIQRKRDFIRENNLCYGCLRSGHLNKDCKRKHTCGTCKKQHPTCLHEEQNPVRRESSADVKVSSFRVNQDKVQGTSMIVPVWVSHKDDPAKEILTYALLDTQSDTTFILNETASALGVDMKPVKLSLSTMTSQNTTIDSSRINDLKVRCFQSSKSDSVTINTAYTRQFIPAERSHIPVKETVKDWQHLQEIETELPPLQSCEVGLLIGYNCPLALAPRRILMGGDTEPYAVQTLLGWSIVGYAKEAHDDYSVTGMVHRTVVKELPVCTPRELINIFEKDFNDNSTKSKKVSQDDLAFISTVQAPRILISPRIPVEEIRVSAASPRSPPPRLAIANCRWRVGIGWRADDSTVYSRCFHSVNIWGYIGTFGNYLYYRINNVNLS